MAVDTFVAYIGVYDNAAGADADYEAVKDLHTKAGLIDAYDAAVIERRAGGKVKITKKHETPTRAGGVLGAGVGLATGLVVVLFPFAAIGGGGRGIGYGGEDRAGDEAGAEGRGQAAEGRHRRDRSRRQVRPGVIRQAAKPGRHRARCPGGEHATGAHSTAACAPAPCPARASRGERDPAREPDHHDLHASANRRRRSRCRR